MDVDTGTGRQRQGRRVVTIPAFSPGGYRFIPAVFQYSGGVAAGPGFRIERVVFREPVPLAQGFQRAEAIIKTRGRPLTAFCACELRSPLPFSDEGFREFNQLYVETLARWGIYDGSTNPVARSNVCPEIDPPAEPSLHAFSFTVASDRHSPTFVVAGSGEAREGGATYRERTVRHGETGADALREKALFVFGEDGAPTGASGSDLGRYHRDLGLHRARPLSFLCRRDRAPRRGAVRTDMAPVPAARARARVRDGLPGRRRGAFRRIGSGCARLWLTERPGRSHTPPTTINASTFFQPRE